MRRGSRLYCGWRRCGRILNGAGLLWSCGLLSTAQTEMLSECSSALQKEAGTGTTVDLDRFGAWWWLAAEGQWSSLLQGRVAATTQGAISPDSPLIRVAR